MGSIHRKGGALLINAEISSDNIILNENSGEPVPPDPPVSTFLLIHNKIKQESIVCIDNAKV